MPSATSPVVDNILLKQLPRQQREKLNAASETVDLRFGDTLCEADHPYTHVYFPLTAFISLVVSVSRHPPLEMGMIGNEGMLGSTLVLGVKTAPLRAIVQGAGTAMRLPISRFSAALRNNAGLRPVLGRYQFVLMKQLSQTAGCTRFHEVDKRLVRWLLMTHDRAHADSFHLTHQFLAEMLGVQRSAVTIAAGTLQQQGLISYTRGQITILNRRGLEALGCECYEAMVGDYHHLLA